jgi:hypothetical protein
MTKRNIQSIDLPSSVDNESLIQLCGFASNELLEQAAA